MPFTSAVIPLLNNYILAGQNRASVKSRISLVPPVLTVAVCGKLNAMVLRAVLAQGHEGDQSEPFVRDSAASVNNICREEQESLKVSNERVGQVLKSLGCARE
jgi:hypothetical protein